MWLRFSMPQPLILARIRGSTRFLSAAPTSQHGNHYKLLVVGGGTGGCAIAAKFAKKMDSKRIAVIEPSDVHYYQPMWTLVGGGMKSLSESMRPNKNVIPPMNVSWIQDEVVRFEPSSNSVHLLNGNDPKVISYEYLVVAMGIRLKYELIQGLPEAFETPGVCSNYSPKYVGKTLEALKNFKAGNAIFTFPNSPVKCAGAPQKIFYIADSYFRKVGKRQNANLIYNTSLGVLFGVKHYADALWKVVKNRDIQVNLRTNLVQVDSANKLAIFEDLDKPGTKTEIPYEMLHVTPPMGPHQALVNTPELTDSAGFVNVNKETLQNPTFPNIFGIGDCTNLPTSKTAAAVAAQCGVLESNLWEVMNGRQLSAKYDGYTSCPLVTSYSACILAEFDYNNQPLETFPINQAEERRSMFHLKKDVMPWIYWNLMLKGKWNGPAAFRKMMKK